MKIGIHQVCDLLRDAADSVHTLNIDGSPEALVEIDNNETGSWQPDSINTGILYQVLYPCTGINLVKLPDITGRNGGRAPSAMFAILFQLAAAEEFTLTLPEGCIRLGAMFENDSTYLAILRLQGGIWFVDIEKVII